MGRRLNCCWHYLLLHLRFWYFDTSILGYLILLINDFGDLNGHLCCLPPTTTAPDTTATMNKLPSYYREWRYPMDTRWRTGQKMASLHAGWRLELLAQSPALSETRHLDTWILDTSILQYLEIWYFWSTTSWRHAPSLPVWPPTPPPLPALLTTSHLATTTSTTTTTTTTTEDTPPLLPTLLSSAAAVPVLSYHPHHQHLQHHHNAAASSFLNNVYSLRPQPPQPPPYLSKLIFVSFPLCTFNIIIIIIIMAAQIKGSDVQGSHGREGHIAHMHSSQQHTAHRTFNATCQRLIVTWMSIISKIAQTTVLHKWPQLATLI